MLAYVFTRKRKRRLSPLLSKICTYTALLKLRRSPFLYILKMHNEGRNGKCPLEEQTSCSRDSLIRRTPFSSIPSQPYKTHLWKGDDVLPKPHKISSHFEVFFFLFLLAYLAVLLPGRGKSPTERHCGPYSLSFKLQNCLTAGTFQLFKRKTSKFSNLPGSHVFRTSFFLSICHERKEFKCTGE